MARCCACDGCIKWRSRKRGSILFAIVCALLLLVAVERVVFDTLGQMWGTLIINCATALCSLVGLAGVCIYEKIAISVFTVWSLISIGLNCVIILIYNDVGLLSKKEHYLGLSVSNNNWWRTNGIGCRDVGGTEGSALGSDGSSNTVKCTLSYATIETIHGVAYIFLTLITLILSFCLLLSKKKDNHVPGDDESFNFVSVSQYQTAPRPHGHSRKWSYSTYDTTISL
ncbi:Sodium/potassium-transporting ATPase subunit beta-1-interacting protein 3 [Geodia barretti]|uniref:Sodium/potassium-transporting ATPase subunit beta-1-interacting protein n=1 Tax=Geodia barretti TaxID=519541 RepID=A0AA35RZU1_GEOBA|nr:Sodium/potassium-transporting ATPase subunit beta-1-interacting protein 3 [Geodia barretti]